MAEEALPITLPDEFYEALNGLKDEISEHYNNEEETLQSKLYSENILNPPDEVRKIAPIFDTNLTDTYKKIGEAFMLGGAKAFFDYWKIIKKQEDYTKVTPKVESKSQPIIKIIQPDSKEPLSKTFDWLNSIFGIIAGAMLTLGIAYGKLPIGQIIESMTYLPRFLKDTFLNEKWQRDTIAKMFKFVKNIARPFRAVARTLERFGRVGESLAGYVRKVGFSMEGGILKTLKEAGFKVFARASKFLRFIPFIGTILGFYQAYQRFNEGEYVQGTLEIAAALTAWIPGIGPAISIGINAYQSLLDTSSSSFSPLSAAQLLSRGKIASSVMKGLAKIAPKLLEPAAKALKFIPFIGALISWGFAINDFRDGNILSGVLNIASGIAQCFPGIGTAIAVGVDLLNWFLGTDTGKETINYVSNTLGTAGQWMVEAWDWMVEKFTEIGNKLYNWISESYNSIKNWFTGIFSGISEWSINAWDATTEFFIEDIPAWINNTVSYIGEQFKSLVTSISGWITNSINWIENKIKSIFDFKLPEINFEIFDIDINISEWFNNIVGNIGDFLAKINPLDIIKSGLDKASKKVQEIIGSFFEDSETTEKNLDERIESAKQDKLSESQNIDNLIKLSHENTIKLINNSQAQIQKIISNNDIYLSKIANSMERLIDVTISKPAGYIDMSSNMNILGGGNNQTRFSSGTDPRLAYK